MEALSRTLSGLPAVPEVVFTSRLAAALVVFQLSILGYDCTSRPSYPSLNPLLSLRARWMFRTADGDG